jgi:hypothetical protein
MNAGLKKRILDALCDRGDTLADELAEMQRTRRSSRDYYTPEDFRAKRATIKKNERLIEAVGKL